MLQVELPLAMIFYSYIDSMSFLRSEGGGILAEEIFYEELILCPKRKQKKNRKNPLKINVEIKKKKERVSNYLIF